MALEVPFSFRTSMNVLKTELYVYDIMIEVSMKLV